MNLIGLPGALRVRHVLRRLFGRPILFGVFSRRAMKRRRVALRRLLPG